MVYLIGAGPGDPGLITVKGLEFIKQCDTIIYDRLGTGQLLEMVKPSCKKIYVGKQAGAHYRKQSEINDILVEEGRKCQMVVRLKGGDPFVFGRGGEEAEALLGAGIPFRIIPGITSAVAVPEVCGIPVTHRGTSRSFHVITGHKMQGSTEEYDYIRNQEGTSVFLMGLSRLPDIMKRLSLTGADIHTPVAVISKGTLPGQKIVRGDIENICRKVEEAKLESPAVIVAGENAAQKLTSPYTGPLQEINVGLVGTNKLREKLAVRINELGGQAYSVVDMRVEASEDREILRKELENIERYTWLAFTSQNTITLFFKWLKEWKIDARRIAHIKFAVVGTGTRDALMNEGYIADYMPEEFTTSALAKGLANVMKPGEKLLLPRAVQGSETMLKILKKGGVDYCEIPVYDVTGRRMESIKYLADINVLTFVSASGVKGFMDVLENERNTKENIDDIMKNIHIAALGQVTEKALERVGYHADIVPETGDIEHLVHAISEYISGKQIKTKEKRQTDDKA